MKKASIPDRTKKEQTIMNLCREFLAYQLKTVDEYRELHLPPEMVKIYDGKPESEATIITLFDGEYADLDIPSERIKGYDKNKELIVEVPFYMKGEVTSEKLVDELTAKAMAYLQSRPDASQLEIVEKVIGEYMEISDAVCEEGIFTDISDDFPDGEPPEYPIDPYHIVRT